MGPIRIATPDDAAALREIYAPYVTETAISFESEAPSVDEMRSRIAATTARHPWLVHAAPGEAIAGYAYATQHRAREAYRWSVDVAVYVRQGHTGRGVGRDLYRVLLPELARLGYANAFAGITLPNAASVALHERAGFVPIGVYRKVGYKLGGWRDVGWWQLALAHPEPPEEPRRFAVRDGSDT